MKDKDKLVERLKEIAPQGRISCEAARKLAEELDISPREVGQACDEVNIRICACELGCF